MAPRFARLCPRGRSWNLREGEFSRRFGRLIEARIPPGAARPCLHGMSGNLREASRERSGEMGYRSRKG